MIAKHQNRFMELVRFDDPLERLLNEVETMRNKWNVGELECVINTALVCKM